MNESINAMAKDEIKRAFFFLCCNRFFFYLDLCMYGLCVWVLAFQTHFYVVSFLFPFQFLILEIFFYVGFVFVCIYFYLLYEFFFYSFAQVGRQFNTLTENSWRVYFHQRTTFVPFVPLLVSSASNLIFFLLFYTFEIHIFVKWQNCLVCFIKSVCVWREFLKDYLEEKNFVTKFLVKLMILNKDLNNKQKIFFYL